MTTTFNTVEELLLILDARPDLRAAVRARVLSRELIEMPEKLAQLSAAFYEFAATTNAAIADLQAGQAKLEAGQEELKAGHAELKEGQHRLESRQDKLEAGQEELKAGQDELKAGHAELKEGQRRIEARQDKFETIQEELKAGQEELKAGHAELKEGQRRIEARQDKFETIQEAVLAEQRSLRSDVRRIDRGLGELRGAFARRVAMDDAEVIAAEMGLVWRRNLRRLELRNMAASPAADGFPINDRRSFRLADLVIEAEDDDGQPHYIAVEVSYTADERDTSRAQRNARYLTHFTGAPAHAAIVAVHIDDRIRSLVDAEDVFWYEFDSRAIAEE